MTKNKFVIALNETENNESSSDDDLTVKKGTDKIEKEPVMDLAQPKKRMNKSGKERAPYVLTDKRKQQFELARQVRMKNIEEAKVKQNESYSQYNDLKQELEKKKMKKLEKIKKKELVKLMAETENISTDESSSDEPATTKIKHKQKKTKTNKQIIIESESESESESETESESENDVVVAPSKKKTTKSKPKPKPKPKSKPKSKPPQEPPAPPSFTAPSFGIRYI